MAKWPMVGYDGTTRLNGFANLYAAFGGDYQSITEANTQQEVRDTYTASNLRLYLSSWVGGAGVDDMIATFRVNGAGGNQTITINATGEHEDVTNTDSLSSGNLINAHFDHSAGAHSDEYTVETFQVTLDASSDVPPIMANGQWTVSSSIRFGGLQGSFFNRTVESNTEYTMRATRVLRDLRVYATNGGGSPTFRVRKNRGDGSLLVTISGTGEFLDTSNTDSFVAGDEADYEFDPVGESTVITVWGVKADTSSGVQMGHDISVGASTEFFTPSGNTTTTTELNAQIEAEDAATIQFLFVNCFTYAETRTIRTRKNAANGAASVSVSGTGLFEDPSNTDSLSAEDDLSIQQDAESSGNNGYLVAVEWETSAGVSTTITALVAEAPSAAPLPTITSVGTISVAGLVAEAPAAALLAAIQIGVTVGGLVAEANAAAPLATITSVGTTTIAGTLATADAAAPLSTITSQEVAAVAGVLATAIAAVPLAEIHIGVTIAGEVSAADAAALLATITSQETTSIAGEIATAPAAAPLATITSMEITSIAGETATADAAVLLVTITAVSGGVSATITGVVSEATAATLLATITSQGVISIAGETATADAAAPLATVQIGISIGGIVAEATAVVPLSTITSVGVVSVPGELAIASAAALLATITSAEVINISGETATAVAEVISAAITAVSSATISGEVAEAIAEALLAAIASQVAASVDGETAMAEALTLNPTISSVGIVSVTGETAVAPATTPLPIIISVVLGDAKIVVTRQTNHDARIGVTLQTNHEAIIGVIKL